MEEPGLTKLIRDIRVIEKALGSDAKRRLPEEQACFVKLAKSIVSTQRISEGTVLTRDMLTTKGPGDGISPTMLRYILERKQ